MIAIGRPNGTHLLGRQAGKLSASLTALINAKVVSESPEGFSLEPAWRTILPEVVSIEAKVSNWRKAVSQAARNQLFSHRSFVALPTNVATRASTDEHVAREGIGVLAVAQDGSVTVVRSAATRERPYE